MYEIRWEIVLLFPSNQIRKVLSSQCGRIQIDDTVAIPTQYKLKSCSLGENRICQALPFYIVNRTCSGKNNTERPLYSKVEQQLLAFAVVSMGKCCYSSYFNAWELALLKWVRRALFFSLSVAWFTKPKGE